MEIGCGWGLGIEILLTLGAAHVTSFDLDPVTVVLAHQRVLKYGDRASIFVGDAETIAAPDATFDVVVDYGVMHHIPHWRQALKEIGRVLKLGGVFYFEDLLKDLITSAPMRTLFEHPHVAQFTSSMFRIGLKAAGLQVRQWRQWGFMGQASK